MKTAFRFVAITLLIAAVYAAGFLYFVESLPRADTWAPRADGIVALTGGDARLDTAIGLLENRAAHRLLITGVFETTTKEELGKRLHAGPRFDCCADIDYTAEDTHDNAEQAAEWAHAHNYKSLIIVTASYHMPRSLAEFSSVMPGVRLVPYPVEPAGMKMQGWWSKPRTLHLLHGEYAKYLAAIIMTSFHHNEETLSASRAKPVRRAGIMS